MPAFVQPCLQYQQESTISVCRAGEKRDSLGRKLNKKRITFTLAVNCKGKIAPTQIIHNAGVSRCMRKEGLLTPAQWFARHNVVYFYAIP